MSSRNNSSRFWCSCQWNFPLPFLRVNKQQEEHHPYRPTASNNYDSGRINAALREIILVKKETLNDSLRIRPKLPNEDTTYSPFDKDLRYIPKVFLISQRYENIPSHCKRDLFGHKDGNWWKAKTWTCVSTFSSDNLENLSTLLKARIVDVPWKKKKKRKQRASETGLSFCFVCSWTRFSHYGPKHTLTEKSYPMNDDELTVVGVKIAHDAITARRTTVTKIRKQPLPSTNILNHSLWLSNSSQVNKHIYLSNLESPVTSSAKCFRDWY